jgi:type II secretory pathway pseudopilin PulG
MRKKYSLTLLEVMIAISLLGTLLAGLFAVFYQSLKNQGVALELKQEVLRFELFQQKMRTLLAKESKVWLGTHLDVKGPVLFFNYEEKADPDFEMCGEIQGMLFLNDQKELCLAAFSKAGKFRVEPLLEKIEQCSYALFDLKEKEWQNNPEKGNSPAMVRIELVQKGVNIPYVFFLKASAETIAYTGDM